MFDDTADYDVTCPACDSDFDKHTVMGILGRRVYYRCPYCGAEFSILIEQNDDTEQEDNSNG